MKPIFQQGSEVDSIELSSYPSTSSSSVPFGSLSPRFSKASRETFLDNVFSQTAQSFNFGEIHAVQERFEALLKQRLLSEYESKPPLFPWESEIGEYPAEVSDFESAVAVSPLWRAYVSALKVSCLLPEALLNSLLDRCQAIACLPMKQGVQLVRAVEMLFPGHTDMLEPIADMVLVPAYRSDSATQDAVTQELINVAGDYDSALPAQQIALSMLAAREILAAMTLSIGGNTSCDSRRWITADGVIELVVSYELDKLTLSAVLPTGGEMGLWDGAMERQSARRSQPGSLDIVWAHPKESKTYAVELSLTGEARPLSLTIHVEG
ncbi:MAG: hypothetical protein HC800_18285 [Phormidesmis sp. RL_2_1]|nr:hypothetical protein [Phormidesmis sp. RL_2_1]